MKDLAPFFSAIIAMTMIAIIVAIALTGNSDMYNRKCDHALQRMELGVDSYESIEIIYEGIRFCDHADRADDAEKIRRWFKARK